MRPDSVFRFLGDMGISPKVVQQLRSQGFDAVHLHEEGLDRLPDADVLAKAQAEQRVLLTHDLDFGYLLSTGGMTAPSVVLFRLADMGPASVIGRLATLLPRLVSPDSGFFAVVTDTRARIRPLPIGEGTGDG